MEMCILCKVCILLFMYIVIFFTIQFKKKNLVACTAMTQSLVPKNFTIGTLVYMMCDNKEIWFDWFDLI